MSSSLVDGGGVEEGVGDEERDDASCVWRRGDGVALNPHTNG